MTVRKIKMPNGQMSPKFYAQFRNHTGRKVRMPLFEQKGLSDKVAAKINDLLAYRKAGAELDPALSRWIDERPQDMRDDLARCGLIDSDRRHASLSLMQNLEGEKIGGVIRTPGLRQYLEGKNGPSRHTAEKVQKIQTLIDAGKGKLRTPSDLTPARVLEVISEMRQGVEGASGISIQTANHYIQAAKQFSRWMYKNGRHHTDTLSALDPVRPAKGENPKVWEAGPFTVEELSALVAFTKKSPTRFGMTGEARAMLYAVAYETGLRSGECRKITPADVSLVTVGGMTAGRVALHGKHAKNRKNAVQYIQPATWEALSVLFAGKASSDPIFTMPNRTNVARMLDKDREEARQAWIDAGTEEDQAIRQVSRFLAKTDDAGKVRHFHSLRHTTDTQLLRVGTDLKTAQSVMRHSDPRLTLERYAHASEALRIGAVLSLPDVLSGDSPVAPLRDTAGSGSIQLSPQLSHDALNPETSADAGGQIPGTETEVPLSQDRPENTDDSFATQQGRSTHPRKPPVGIEPTTSGLQNRCSAN